MGVEEIYTLIEVQWFYILTLLSTGEGTYVTYWKIFQLKNFFRTGPDGPPENTGILKSTFFSL